MSSSYKQISTEVGYVGYMPYPELEEVDQLLSRLSSNPTILDFKRALSLYRFLPEAKTPEQEKMIYMVQSCLYVSREKLFTEQPQASFVEVAVKYIMNLIPSLLPLAIFL